MSETRTIVMDSGREVQAEHIACYSVHNLIVRSRNKTVGRALIVVPAEGDFRNQAVLLDIYVYDEKDRRQGVADELMSVITEHWSSVVTSFNSKAGRELCLKHGFRWRRAMHKNAADLLVYVREPTKEEADVGTEEDCLQRNFRNPEAGSQESESGKPGLSA